MPARLDPSSLILAPDAINDYENLCQLLSVLTEARNRLEELENEINREFLDIIDQDKEEYARYQQAIAEATEALEITARRNPDWFKDGKTVKTPFGSVSLKDNPPKLDVKSEEWSIDLIEKSSPEDREKYLRKVTVLNLEALGELPDEELLRFRIRRTRGDRFEAKPAKVDMGKAVKEAEKKEGSGV